MPTPRSDYRWPCARCGASLRFAPGERSLTCEHCGHVQAIGDGPARAPARQQAGGAAGEAAILADPATGRALQWDAAHKAPDLAEIPLADGLSLDEAGGLAEAVPLTLACPNCGARIEAEADRHAHACPFCATPVVTDTGAARRIKPQGVLPFVVTEAQARAALEDWLAGLWFAPSGLTAYARSGRPMAGVYSPFWTFDADTVSAYEGQRGEHYFETVWVTEVIDGKPRRVARQVMRTRWHPAAGTVRRDFDDVLVLATASLPRRFADGLTPWDLSHLVPYRPDYLAGFLAEAYTIPLADGHEVARGEMAGVIAIDVRRAIGGDVQRVAAIRTRHSAESFKQVLLPVWSAAYRYNGRSYRFVVNGQSGRVQGERPWSVWKIGAAALAGLMLAAAALWLAHEGGYVTFDPQPAGVGIEAVPGPAVGAAPRGF